MAAGTKATFSLDSATIDRINSLGQRWHVSKTEVLRRAVRQADERVALDAEQRIEAMRHLQESLKRRRIDFEKWKETIRNGRR
ncbi:hypothetical protein BH20VER1_BH20VER1_03230 [soil metagenome]